MKIAQVIPFYAPAWGYGGPVKVCSELSTELAKRGNQVTVLTTDAYDHLKRMDKVCEVIDGVKVLRFRNVSNKLAKNSNLYMPKGFRAYLKNNVKDFDIVHLHAFYTLQNIFAAKYCVKYSIPYVLHLHEKFDTTVEMGKSKIKKVFMSLYGKFIIYNAQKIFVLSANEESNLLSFDSSLKDKIEIIPNPAPPYQGKCSSNSILRKKYGLGANSKVVLSLSRLSIIKGIDLLIRAFAIIAKEDPGFRLIIAGPDEGGQKSRLEKIIKDENVQNKVIFTGMAADKIKEELFCIADVFALFSRYESFGIVVLESLAHGLPVCLSKNVGVAKEIYDKGSATICDPCNTLESTLELKKAFDSRGKLAKNCKEALKGFDLGSITDRVISTYNKIISK